ncbi:hypothetical protein TNCV_1797541 [Trichonephila clavipes]|nr:hypothetical protein TNCV_1797541 [Trichonephila clavipes]
MPIDLQKHKIHSITYPSNYERLSKSWMNRVGYQNVTNLLPSIKSLEIVQSGILSRKFEMERIQTDDEIYNSLRE